MGKCKRVQRVSVRMVKESSFLYEPCRVTSPSQGVQLVKPYLEDLDREQFLVVCLDTKVQPTNMMCVSKGSLNASIVHPREVFKTAILSNAASILISHNHPSGHPEPSNEDAEITKRLQEAGQILGIKVLDHIIVGEDSYYSFKENSNIIE